MSNTYYVPMIIEVLISYYLLYVIQVAIMYSSVLFFKLNKSNVIRHVARNTSRYEASRIYSGCLVFIDFNDNVPKYTNERTEIVNEKRIWYEICVTLNQLYLSKHKIPLDTTSNNFILVSCFKCMILAIIALRSNFECNYSLFML